MPGRTDAMKPRPDHGEDSYRGSNKLAGKKAFDEMAKVEARTMATDCPLAAVQFEQALGWRRGLNSFAAILFTDKIKSTYQIQF